MLVNISTVFMIFFLITVAIGIYIIYTFSIPAPKRFELFAIYLGGFATILLAYNVYTNVQFNERVEKNRTAYDTVKNIQKNYLAPQQELVDFFPESFSLYASMNPDVDFEGLEPKTFDAAKRKMVELFGAIRIFQAVEDFLSTALWDLTGQYVWLNNFLMWMQSPILQQYWKELDFNYSDDTRELMNRIIEKADELSALRKDKGTLTAADYDAISKAFSVKVRA